MAKARIPEQIVEEIRARNDIVAVVEQYVRLEKRSGANFFGLCPFHREDTPSFSVSPGKQIYYCFGCHKGGNVVGFIMEIEKTSYPEALRFLAERVGIEIPEADDEQTRRRSELLANLSAIMLEAARYYYTVLQGEAGAEARAYLTRRGVNESTRRRFGLGCASKDWDGLYRHVRAKGFTDTELLLKSGLFRKGRNEGLYDLFRGRLMFPIFDVLGRVIAFGGRVLDDSQPKYINSPETPLYTKGRHLYALNIAKTSRAGHLVIVEGYMDALSMHQAGIDSAVAALGTALTPNQALMARKYTENVVIGFDADAAGQNAAIRSLDILAARGIKVSVLMVPDGKDPDDFIRLHGPERFQALIDQALPLMDFKLFVARRNNTHGDALNILDFQNEACSILAVEENIVVRELYAARVAEILRTSTESVVAEVERRRHKTAAEPQRDLLRERLMANEQNRTGTGDDENVHSITRLEVFLLTLLASEPELLSQLEPELRPENFTAGAGKQLAELALPLIRAQTLTPAGLIDLAADMETAGKPLRDILAQAAMSMTLTDTRSARLEAAREFWKRHRLNHMKQVKDEINIKIEQETDPEAREELKEQLLQLTAEINKRG